MCLFFPEYQHVNPVQAGGYVGCSRPEAEMI